MLVIKRDKYFVGFWFGQTSMIMKIIRNLLQENLPPDDIAILSYSRTQWARGLNFNYLGQV